MKKIIDRTGRQYGRLTVTGKALANSSKHIQWKCLCKCGKKVTVFGSNLSNGNTVSCGCYRLEQLAKCRAKRTKHGESNTRLYRTWLNMKSRCYNSNSANYHSYGKCGIKVCKEWRKCFVTFRNWALANGYSDDLTIDRIDNDGDYFPENCRWVTKAEQQRNKRNSVYFQSTLLIDIAQFVDISYMTLWFRLRQNPNITYDRLTRPSQRKGAGNRRC
jgi:hypothetical protein